MILIQSSYHSLTHPGDGQGLVEVLSSCQAETPGGRPVQHDVNWHDPLIFSLLSSTDSKLQRNIKVMKILNHVGGGGGLRGEENRQTPPREWGNRSDFVNWLSVCTTSASSPRSLATFYPFVCRRSISSLKSQTAKAWQSFLTYKDTSGQSEDVNQLALKCFSSPGSSGSGWPPLALVDGSCCSCPYLVWRRSSSPRPRSSRRRIPATIDLDGTQDSHS